MIRAIIVDDEELGGQVLEKLLTKYCPGIELVARVDNIVEAKQVILSDTIDLAFLDVKMPDGGGFELLKEIDEQNFDVVFTTAYDEYALKAIKVSAVDYLLKPIQIEELILAVDKVQKRINEKLKLVSSQPVAEESAKSPGSIAIPNVNGLDFIQTNDLIRCEADGKYTMCYLVGGKEILSTKNLKGFEDILKQQGFFRVHHSHLVNLKHISQYIRTDGGHLTMTNGDLVTVSKRKKEDFLKALNIV